MEDNQNKQLDEKLKSWIKKQLKAAVDDLLVLGVYESVVVEAKPAWVLPFGLLIGKIREQGQAAGFDWFICGDFPTAMAPSTMASTPRKAARHFALQWQLEAIRQTEAEGKADSGTLASQVPDSDTSLANSQLVKRAESLYELIEQESLWQQ